MLYFVGWFGCLILWTGGVILTIIKKNPIVVYALFLLHAFETLVVGFKTGTKFGKKPLETVINCIFYGFTWWLPLKNQMKRETFTDDDFVRTPDDMIIYDD